MATDDLSYGFLRAATHARSKLELAMQLGGVALAASLKGFEFVTENGQVLHRAGELSSDVSTIELTCLGERLAVVRLSPATELAQSLGHDLGANFLRLREARHEHDERELLMIALDNIDDRIFIMKDDSPKFSYVNESAARTLGYSKQELTSGMTVFDVDREMGQQGWDEMMSAVRQVKRMTIERHHTTRSGERIPIEVSGNYFELRGRTYNMAIARDIRERKRNEAALREREELFRTLVENIPDFIIRWNAKLERVFVNGKFARALGRSSAELMGEPFGTGFLPQTKPGLATAEHVVRKVFQTGHPELLEIPFVGTHGDRVVQLRVIPERAQDGSVATVLGVARDITVLKRTEEQLRSLADNSPDIVLRFDSARQLVYSNEVFREFSRLGSDARARFLDELSAHVERGLEGRTESGKVCLQVASESREYEVRLVLEQAREQTLLVIVRDLTSERRLERQLLQAQKLEAVGTLAGGIAHDFNNMLAVISVNASLIDEERLDASAKESLQEIRDAATRSMNLTRQLLTFSRRQVTQMRLVSLGEVVAGVSKLVRRLVSEAIRITTKIAPELPEVNADAGMVEQAVMNLVINARDAMPSGGSMSLEVDRVDGGIVLAVSDTGTGIARAVLPRIFDPFFTTKEVGKGTGLGLATVYAIMQQHGGRVDVESEEGRGSRFTLWFPIAQDGGREAPLLGRTASGGDETILLVEDDDLVRRSIRNVLVRAGYRVFDASAPSQALAFWAAHRDEVDLVVSDVTMPERSGPDLVKGLRAERPGLKVLFVSGYQLEPVGESEQGIPLLRKPFEVATLLAAVRAALDGSSPR